MHSLFLLLSSNNSKYLHCQRLFFLTTIFSNFSHFLLCTLNMLIISYYHFCLYLIKIFFKLIFIGMQLLYNVVLGFATQQNESAIFFHISSLFGFPSHLGHQEHWVEFSVLCSRLPILSIVSVVYMSMPVPKFIPPHHLSPLVSIHLFSSASLFMLCK